MKITLAWVLLALVLAITGCSTTGQHVQWYEGPPLSTNQIAVLRVQRGLYGVHLHVHQINGVRLDKGKNVGNNTKEIELAPGKYELSAAYFGPTARSTADAIIDFTAEAGKIYELRGARKEMSPRNEVRFALIGGHSPWTM